MLSKQLVSGSLPGDGGHFKAAFPVLILWSWLEGKKSEHKVSGQYLKPSHLWLLPLVRKNLHVGMEDAANHILVWSHGANSRYMNRKLDHQWCSSFFCFNGLLVDPVLLSDLALHYPLALTQHCMWCHSHSQALVKATLLALCSCGLVNRTATIIVAAV